MRRNRRGTRLEGTVYTIERVCDSVEQSDDVLKGTEDPPDVLSQSLKTQTEGPRSVTSDSGRKVGRETYVWL